MTQAIIFLMSLAVLVAALAAIWYQAIRDGGNNAFAGVNAIAGTVYLAGT